MKFGFISTMGSLPWGGSEDLWSETAACLVRQDHTAIACVHDWGRQEAAPLKRLEELGVGLHRRHQPPQLTTLGLVTEKIAHRLGLRRPRISAYESFASTCPNLTLVSLPGSFPEADSCGPLVRAGLPFVVLVQSAAEQWWPTDPARREAISLLQAARAVLFVSEANRRLVARQLAYDHPQTRVVRNPFRVPYETLLPWPEPAAPLRLAFVGRLEPDAKGCDLALEALADPVWKDRNLTLTFFGTGRAEEGVRALSDRLGLGPRVRFAGHARDIVSIWRDHHALLLPSRYEGMPLAIVEAMLCGRPCIATAVAGHAEFITEGQTGFLANFPTVESVNATLLRAWDSRQLWPGLGAEARRRVRQLVPSAPAQTLADLLLELTRSS